MSAEVGLSGSHPLPAPAPAAIRSREHRFFGGMAALCAVVVFAGFSPTYYLRSLYGGPALSGLVHLHGALSTAWMLLFLTQNALVLTGRTPLHRRLGLLAGVLVPVLAVVGWSTAIEAARHGVTPPGGPPPLAFLAIPLGTILTFAVLAATGLLQRHRSEIHKRLMLLATIALIMPALARLSRWFSLPGPLLGTGGTVLLVLVCIGYDRRTRGRIHPGFLWGGVFLLASILLRFAVAASEGWLPVAAWLTR